LKFTVEQAREFYKHQHDKPHFNDLVKYMTSGESCVLALTKSKAASADDLVNTWRNDVGPADLAEAKKQPDTLRAQFATDQMINALHSSDSHEAALRFEIDQYRV
jgi:nucleoside diphosphate kinase